MNDSDRRMEDGEYGIIIGSGEESLSEQKFIIEGD
jgi:hypothetical protein